MSEAPDDMAVAGAVVRSRELTMHARLKDYESELMSGTYTQVDRARDFVLGAVGALLDAKYSQAFHLLKSWGIDPTKRVR